MLREAVKNVLDNAVRHGRAGAGGSIVIRLFTDRTDATHCLSVSDGGPGIKEPHRARVFERFQRGSATEAPGSGLGLAILKSVVDAHGGRGFDIKHKNHFRLSNDCRGGRRCRSGSCRKSLCHLIRSEEHTSELQSLMRISYAVFCLKKKINN